MVEQREIFRAEFQIVYVDTLLSRRQNVTSHSKSIAHNDFQGALYRNRERRES